MGVVSTGIPFVSDPLQIHVAVLEYLRERMEEVERGNGIIAQEPDLANRFPVS